ncbi:MAG: tetratricopeptide repeat protein, partial [Treponemataceae bacterium]|nr:tetratricopeptide repeat protein [Treponemataceae bacterium]
MEAKIQDIYNKGLEYYAYGEMEKAIETWQEILKMNPFYDPAISGIESARMTLKLQERINKANFFD